MKKIFTVMGLIWLVFSSLSLSGYVLSGMHQNGVILLSINCLCSVIFIVSMYKNEREK